MRRLISGRFWLSYLFSLLMHFGWAIPGIALFFLRIWFDIPLYVPFIAIGLWLVAVFIRLFVFSAVSSYCESVPESSPAPCRNGSFKPGSGSAKSSDRKL